MGVSGRHPIEEMMDAASKQSWLVKGLLPSGARIVNGAHPATGKSFFTSALAVAVASGTPFAQRFGTMQGPVLIVDQDSAVGDLAERLCAFSKGAGLDSLPTALHLVPHDQIHLDTGDGRKRFEAHLLRVRPTLVIIDTLDAVASSGLNENKAHHVKRIFEPLTRLSHEYGFAFIVNHHLSKASTPRHGANALRGSSAISGSVDIVFTLQKVPGPGGYIDRLILQKPKTRFSVTGDGVYRLDFDRSGQVARLKWLRPVHADYEPQREVDYEMIRGIVARRGPEGASVEDVTAEVNGILGLRDIRDLLRSLHAMGEIARSKERSNRYRYFDKSFAPKRIRPIKRRRLHSWKRSPIYRVKLPNYSV